MATTRARKPPAERPDLSVETARGRVVATWSPRLDARVNRADEDLVLRVQDGQGATVRQYKVSQFCRKEFALAPGRYRLELVRCRQPELEVRTTGRYTPTVVWVSDSPASHVVTWSGIDWAAVQYQVEHLYHVDWSKETELALRVLWQDGVQGEWAAVPHRDHFTLRGPAASVELAIRRVKDGQILKTILQASRRTAQDCEVLAGAELDVPSGQHPLELTRITIETDTLQLRAQWALDEAPDELRLELLRDGKPFRPHEKRQVGRRGDWYFWGMEAGRYVARLVDGKARTVQESPAVDLADEPAHVVLMPIDEKRLYAYWHVGPSAWRELAERHGELMGRVTCFLRVYHEWAGGLHHHAHHDREVNLGAASDYYLALDCDRIYRVQLVAVVDGWKVEELTPVSNPAQTGRLSAGSNPRSYRWVPDPISHPTIRPLESAQGTSRFSHGYLLLHLHAHLPFIPDPVNFDAGDTWRPMGYPQEWYPEAVRETYLPLLDLFERLTDEGVDFKMSLDLSPPLVAMMRSARHQADVLEYLERLIQLAHLEVERTRREEPHYHTVARMHLRHLRRGRDLFQGYGCDLSQAFRKFQDLGKLEILTCVGTHPMLPLWLMEPQAIRGQVFAAMDYHLETFGRPSVGIWLPECAYAPGVEKFLEEAGIRYFFSEGVTVLRGDSPAEFGVNAPVYVRGSSVAVFPRDPETGEQVWSGEIGYPGDPDYLDFHIRGGPFKYNRITSRESGLHKEPYNPDWATNKASNQAQHFMDSRNQRFEWLRHTMWKKPLVVAPYDAELFGHHWYEGPQFLYFLLKKLHYDQNATELTTGAAYLAENATSQEIWPSVSSWGQKASFEKWMHGANAWMYRHAHQAAREMSRMVHQGIRDEMDRRVLQQSARQLMLAMSSDLPFVISNGHFIDRMKMLFFDALRGFWELSAMFWRSLDGGTIDVTRLRELELEHNLFPDVDPARFA